MDASLIESPYVWGGGILIGVVLLVTKSSHVATAVGQTAATVNPAVLSASTAMNAAALGAQISFANANADVAKTKISADVASQSLFYSYLKNQDDNNTVLAGKQMESNAGITTALISSNTAITVDQSNNANRLALAYVGANVASITADANVKVAQLQSDAAKAASRNSLFGTIAGAIGGVAKAALI